VTIEQDKNLRAAMMEGIDPELSLEDRLWMAIERESHAFCALRDHRSDLFSLLAYILAFYEVRGTRPEQMIGEAMKQRIDWLIRQYSG